MVKNLVGLACSFTSQPSMMAQKMTLWLRVERNASFAAQESSTLCRCKARSFAIALHRIVGGAHIADLPSIHCVASSAITSTLKLSIAVTSHRCCVSFEPTIRPSLLRFSRAGHRRRCCLHWSLPLHRSIAIASPLTSAMSITVTLSNPPCVARHCCRFSIFIAEPSPIYIVHSRAAHQRAVRLPSTNCPPPIFINIIVVTSPSPSHHPPHHQ